MKLTSPMIAAISIAVLLCLVQAYVDIQWMGASGELGRLKGASEAHSAQLASLQGSVSSFSQSVKQYDAAIGPHGSIQVLASGLQSGDIDLNVKSLKVVSNGKTVVSLGSAPDAGGVIQVAALDGTASAEIASGPGRSRLAFRETTGGADAQVVRVATYGGAGLYLQRGATDDMAARTDGAGFQIADAGADFFMAQNQGGNVTIDTTGGDERAKLSLFSSTGAKKIVSLSVGGKDGSPYLSEAGAASGYSLTLVPDRLSLLNKDGSETLVAAGDTGGGFFIANDQGGERRAIMASGTEGHGSLSVFGNDNRSNTFLPEFDIQKKGTSSQK
jgi:hypothetical protein